MSTPFQYRSIHCFRRELNYWCKYFDTDRNHCYKQCKSHWCSKWCRKMDKINRLPEDCLGKFWLNTNGKSYLQNSDTRCGNSYIRADFHMFCMETCTERRSKSQVSCKMCSWDLSLNNSGNTGCWKGSNWLDSMCIYWLIEYSKGMGANMIHRERSLIHYVEPHMSIFQRDSLLCNYSDKICKT